MTTSPVTNLNACLIPGQADQATGQPGAQGSTADAFLALVQGLLDDASGQPALDPTAVAAGTVEGSAGLVEGLPATEDAEAAPVVDATATLPDPNAVAMPVFVPQTIQIQPPTPTAAQPMAPEASAPVDAVTSVAAVATAASAPVATAQAAEAAVLPAAPKGALPTDDVRTTALPADGPAPTSGTAAAAKVELPDVAVQATEQRPATTGPTTETAAQQAPAAPTQAPAPAQAPTVAPVSGAAPIATTAPVASAPSDTQQVTQQVFPEVVRVVNNPNGPQRLTIKLNPEALGEVRVVLTSRQGGLEVSLAAGSDARTALTEGAPELQRLLDLVGRGDARIVVRELNGTLPGTTVSQPNTASTGSGVPNDLAGGAGTGTGRPGGEATSGHQHRNHPAGSSNATDGTPGATNPSRPIDSVTRGAHSLDVTM